MTKNHENQSQTKPNQSLTSRRRPLPFPAQPAAPNLPLLRCGTGRLASKAQARVPGSSSLRRPAVSGLTSAVNSSFPHAPANPAVPVTPRPAPPIALLPPYRRPAPGERRQLTTPSGPGPPRPYPCSPSSAAVPAVAPVARMPGPATGSLSPSRCSSAASPTPKQAPPGTRQNGRRPAPLPDKTPASSPKQIRSKLFLKWPLQTKPKQAHKTPRFPSSLPLAEAPFCPADPASTPAPYPAPRPSLSCPRPRFSGVPPSDRPSPVGRRAPRKGPKIA